MGERKSGDLITPNPQHLANTKFLDLALLYPMDKWHHMTTLKNQSCHMPQKQHKRLQYQCFT